MSKTTFTITGEELREKSFKTLSNNQVLEALNIIENDFILWDEIDKSIQEAISAVTKK